MYCFYCGKKIESDSVFLSVLWLKNWRETKKESKKTVQRSLPEKTKKT